MHEVIYSIYSPADYPQQTLYRLSILPTEPKSDSTVFPQFQPVEFQPVEFQPVWVNRLSLNAKKML